jgi:hypothetical protein
MVVKNIKLPGEESPHSADPFPSDREIIEAAV